MSKAGNWITVTESPHPWERDALNFVREQFPSHDPYRAWSNFEFIADDGSINEVDLLIFTPQGFFLVEIKSNPGRLYGDAGTWTWDADGKLKTVDNPLFATNLKAKKLRSLLERQKAAQKKGRLPYLDALVFCSAPELHCELQGNARFHVCLRDRAAVGETPERPGILAAIKRRECPGLDPYAKGTFDRPMMKVVSQAMEQAGIRPSQRNRKVSDYILEQIIDEGPGYQDWRASHSQVAESKRRVRLYLVRTEATVEDRKRIERAALREFQILETLGHPGILKVNNFTEHEVGPALLFEHDPTSIRLDHYLAQQKDKLTIDEQLNLVRQIAEVVRYAHEKKVVHRALCPQSILVTHVAGHPRLKVFNWQVGYRQGTSTSGVSRIVSATSHVDQLVEDAGKAYMAPEALTEDNTGEHLDVFSLGAIAYRVFSGVAPAADGLELSNKLRGTTGLQISSVMNGAGEWLQMLVQEATNPIVSNRTDSVVDFLATLDEVENELTSPVHDFVEDPTQAQIGDVIEGGYTVIRRLGQGACSVALLVERDGQDYVLKVASDPDLNVRLRDEIEVLNKLRHAHIVEFVQALELGDRVAFLMHPVYADRQKKLVETLGERLRKDGRLHVDLLQRFGEDLLDVVNYLEEQGIPHRDIKPHNIAVGSVGRGNKLHLVLFDFSLSRTPPDNIRAGTSGYLDPLLALRKPPRWDLHAERYAAAVTLYELATGSLPKWGDGATDPSHLSAETEITIDSEAFEASLREPLTEFFATAFRRNINDRFDNCETMLGEWRECFKGIDESGPLSDHADESQLRELLADATFDTHIGELGLGTRASNALDLRNILTVEDLLTVPLRRIARFRGVGNKTRREIAVAVKILRERLGAPNREQPLVPGDDEAQTDTSDVGNLSVDLIADRILKTGAREGETFQRVCQLLLGLDPAIVDCWPSQSDVARVVDVTRARIGQIIGKMQDRWGKELTLTRLRDDLAELIVGQGGVMSTAELAEAVLLARGSSLDEPKRSKLAAAVVRACFEVERAMTNPRFIVRRDGNLVLIALNAELADYARRLGGVADELSKEDPLVAPMRCLERLRGIQAPGDVLISDARLIRLAAIASEQAAVSSQKELYPRGMSALRALKLSQGTLLGMRTLTVDQIRERIASRYPEAAPLPDYPEVDGLLEEAGFNFRWNPEGKNGVGCYSSPLRDPVAVSSASESVSRWHTTNEGGEAGDVTPEEADARQFEERLTRAIQEGSFLTLLVSPKYYDRARDELCRRFPLQLVDFEGLFLDSLHNTAEAAKVKWDLVLKTDAHPHDGDWDKLMMLVGRCMPAVEQKLHAVDKTMLVIYPGLLARYDQMALLSRLSQKVGRRDGIPGLWLLLPGDGQALIDSKPVPLIGPGQKARIPTSWLKNLHRGNGKQEVRE